ncbi:MAG TPA: SDR family NAD(P)-dependent oxidoreductase [Puia sp.]|jgi:3-hydroxy acid dehydrogenase/malonic semialdehyde reductase|nr:SDR family NAD(P)-dependent oxidoreductase [Puia sp.]
MNKIALITGATSGFGKACAYKFAANNYDVIITGRRKEKLDELKTDLEKKYGVKILSLPFDVQNREEVFSAVENIPDEWQKIDVLINNAGLALGRDFFEEADIDDWETMLDTNVKGLLYVSKAVLPFMIKNKKGHIINMGSVAAKVAYEKGNVYCASKAAVETISETMRIDLLRHGIKVTAIHPGAAETEFSDVRFKGNKELAKKVYEGYEPLHAEDIADTIFYCATLPPHVCINDLVITCTAQADSIYFYKKIG